MATRPQLEGYRPVKRRRPAGNRGLKRARSQVRDALHALPAELREDIETPACPWEDIPAPAYLMPPPELPRAVGERVLIDGARAKIVKVSRKDGHKLKPAIFSLFGPADGEEDEAAGGSALPQPQPFLLGSVPHDAARTEALAGSTRQPATTAGTASAVRQEGAAAGSAPAARAEAELEPVLFMRTHTEDELTVQWQQRRQQGFKDFKSKHKTDVRQALKRKRQLALRGGQGARGKQRVLRATSHRR